MILIEARAFQILIFPNSPTIMDYSKQIRKLIFWFELIDQDEVERVLSKYLKQRLENKA